MGARKHHRPRQHEFVKASPPVPVINGLIPCSCLLLLGLLLTGFLTFYSRAGLRQRLSSIISACSGQSWPHSSHDCQYLLPLIFYFFVSVFLNSKFEQRIKAPFFLSLLCHKSLAFAQEPMHRPGEHGNHGCPGGRVRVRHGHGQSSWRHA